MRTVTVSISMLVAVTLTSACQPSLEDEYKRAIPDQDDLAIEVPGEGGDAAAGIHEQALVGERAFLYQVTRDVSRIINGGVYITLGILREIVRHRASEVDETHAIWGPATPTLSPLTWRFEVRRLAGEGEYEYVLEAKPKAEGDDAYVAVLSGQADVDGDDRGRGTFVIDNDALHALDQYEHRGAGTATVSYDLQGEPVTIDVSFANWTGGWHDPVDATYHYRENLDQSGAFSYSATADVDEDGSLVESLVVTSRWVSGGAGRGDARVEGGNVTEGLAVVATECWDDGFGRTYWTDDAGIHETEGDVAACPFDTAANPGQ